MNYKSFDKHLLYELRYVQELTYVELGRALGCTKDTARKKCLEHDIPTPAKFKRNDLGDTGFDRKFIGAELLAYEMALRQGLSVEVIAHEHRRPVDFVLEKLKKL